jgi:hypothetical protein
MLKKSFFILVMALFVFSCNSDTKSLTEEATSDETTTETTTLKVEDFETMAANFVGQKILISGTVDHTCKHSGKRMVILGENPDYSVKIEAGEVDQFNRELEGSDVSVLALVTEMRMDRDYLDNWEQEILKNHADDEDGGADQLAEIENYRIELKNNENGHLSFYGLDCVSYEVIAEGPKEDKKDESEM